LSAWAAAAKQAGAKITFAPCCLCTSGEKRCSIS
jgi:hypothetical protein